MAVSVTPADPADGSRRPFRQPVDGLEDLEVDLLLEAMYRHYGFDFRGYARGSLKRRLWRRVYAEKVDSLTGLQERVLHDPVAMDRLVLDLSVNVTAMFRHPSFFLQFRSKVVPLLRTYPFIRIWNAGCSTGEETYSIAITLLEEGLLPRSRLYATDINEAVLQRAQQGVFPLERMRDYTENYIAAGGTRAFSEYYTAEDDGARFRPEISANVVFAQHNLVSDRSFNEFHVIVCRNVMIYFDKALQNHVFATFHDSLVRFGVLALGHKESLRFTTYADRYEELDRRERLYRKTR